ncbi:ABC transporter substrate-binding protein [Desulfonema magnum]|uniref:Leucine-binding domain-containing protein n=1 Tax=Desulfonema magnum TaxID=45655 RepID=A0A975BUN2_9BACT|nr:ABC transporter substrate-binding protein [Desulfonema magnum]QTA91642.1 Leucine-binding domain-containing protein [Desulfonema magnum]
MKKIRRIVFATVFWSAVCLSVLCDAKAPIYIGLSAPMTGQYAEAGRSFHEGAELAIEKINRAGGIDGHPIALIVGDSKGEPKIAKRVARRFTEDKRIIAEIGDFTSSCSLAAQPIYHRAGMIQLSPTSSHPSFAPGSPYSFGIVGTQAGEGPFMARMAVERLVKKKLAVAYLNTDWGIVLKKFFVEKAKQLGAEIVAQEPYLEGTTDFSALTEKIRTSEPDLLFLASMVPDAAGICRQIQKSGWNDVILVGSRAMCTSEFIKLGKDSSENVVSCTLFAPDDPRPEVQNFIKAYKTSYNLMPDWFAAIAYDTMNLLAEAIKQGGTDRKAIHKVLSNIKEFSGITGKITFSKYGDVAREYLLLHVKNGEFVPYQQ